MKVNLTASYTKLGMPYEITQLNSLYRFNMSGHDQILLLSYPFSFK